MSNGDIERIIYYKGQVLTADDFSVQQEYHRNKFTRFVQRFPRGIVTGLHVVRSPADKNNPDDYDAFKIEAGLAFDEEGNTIVVPERGYRISIDEFRDNRPYINLLYKEEKILSNGSTINGVRQNNRIIESIHHEWTAISNKITTVAKIRKKKEGDESKIAEVKMIDDLVILEEEEDNKSGKANIRKNAGILGTDQIEDDAIIAKKIANGAVESAKIAANAVDTTKLANNAVHSTKIAESAIGTRELADNAVGRDQIEDNAVTADKLAPNAVTIHKIAASAVDTSELADAAVSTIKIADGAINENKLATGAVTGAKLASGAVTVNKINTNAVATNKIQGGAVTSAKIQDGAVTSLKLDIATEILRGTSGSGDDNPDVRVQVEPGAIINVIPTTGRISWTTKLEAADRMLTYVITIRNENEDTSSLCEWRILKIDFGQIGP